VVAVEFLIDENTFALESVTTSSLTTGVVVPIPNLLLVVSANKNGTLCI
jgi:hypothetical protein